MISDVSEVVYSIKREQALVPRASGALVAGENRLDGV
jgi:hypothetical protein